MIKYFNYCSMFLFYFVRCATFYNNTIFTTKIVKYTKFNTIDSLLYNITIEYYKSKFELIVLSHLTFKTQLSIII